MRAWVRRAPALASRGRPLLEEPALAVTPETLRPSPGPSPRAAGCKALICPSERPHCAPRPGARLVCAASLPCFAITSLWCHGKKSALWRPRSRGPRPLPMIRCVTLAVHPSLWAVETFLQVIMRHRVPGTWQKLTDESVNEVGTVTVNLSGKYLI